MSDPWAWLTYDSRYIVYLKSSVPNLKTHYIKLYTSESRHGQILFKKGRNHCTCEFSLWINLFCMVNFKCKIKNKTWSSVSNSTYILSLIDYPLFLIPYPISLISYPLSLIPTPCSLSPRTVPFLHLLGKCRNGHTFCGANLVSALHSRVNH